MIHPIRSFAKRLARHWPSAVLSRRRGARFILHPQNWLDNRLLVGAPFEGAQIAAAKAVIAERNIDLVIDVGANIGLYTVLLGAMPQVRSVICFEPVRRNFAQLMGNVFVNNLCEKVDAHRLALGAKNGAAVIHIDPRSTGVSRLELDTAARHQEAFSRQEWIETAVFDDLFRYAGRRAFVKIDVEGGAAAALHGMRNFLSSNDVVLQVELTNTERKDATAILDNAGYSISREIDGDVIFTRR